MERWLGSALEYIPTWVNFQVRMLQQPGCLLAIVHDGKVVLEHATGLANMRTGQKLTPRHRFRIASHSKSFTAAGILKLREQGKLGLDDPIGKYVRGLHRGVAAARLSQVLSHGAGITRDGDDAGWFVGHKPYPDMAKLRELLSAPPVIEAGERLKYSNPGFALLGLVIESVTGEPYARWIGREIVAAAGLRHTSADGPVKRGTPFARGHTALMPLGRRLVLKGDEPLRALAPAGGFVSTAADTALFFNQLNPAARKSVLSRASRREMVHRQWRNVSAIESYYGLGLQSGPVAGWNIFGHGDRRDDRADVKFGRRLEPRLGRRHHQHHTHVRQQRAAGPPRARLEGPLVVAVGRLRPGTGRQSGAGWRARFREPVLRPWRDRSDRPRHRQGHGFGWLRDFR
jgi:CubicO group peptidase (beta-lactamase class C family)